MTRKRRNILIRFLVSMLALLAIAVPVAQAEPGGLFDGASTKPETPVPYAWLLDQSDREQLPNVVVDSATGNLTNAAPADAVDRYVEGNAPIVPNAVPGYPAILPEVAAPSATTDQLPAFPPGPGGYVEPTVPPATDLRPFLTDGPRGVGIAPVTEPVAEPTGGFDWRDAAIGFSVAAVLALLAAGSVLILRNRDRVATGMS